MEAVNHRARTKIVATLGPVSRSPEVIMQLAEAGADVFRLNMAHGDLQEHDESLRNIRQVSQQIGRPLGVLVDLAGPKIRLGEISPDPLECSQGKLFTFVRGEVATQPGELTTNYPPLVDELSVDDRILLADGTVAMRVIEKHPDRVVCRVVGPGQVRSRQGVNLPGAKLSVPALSAIDRQHAVWAAEHDVDFVGLSFVRSAADVLQLRELLRQHGSPSITIAKIEKPEALEQLEEIVGAAGGIMVARGDLGVEIDVAEMPLQQKRIIDACSRLGKPVIVATQMLDSMQHSSRPTRAEVTDVANAILDGTDACMLSGETAVGKYPCESVEMMNRIMLASEKMLQNPVGRRQPAAGDTVHPVTTAVVFGAALIARQLQAQMVVIATRSGATAQVKSKQRDFIRTVAISDTEATLRRMCLFWGIEPLRGAPADLGHGLIKFIDRWGREERCLVKGDRVVIVTGTGMEPGAHNMVIVHEVE